MKNISNKKIILIVVAIEILAVAIFIKDYKESTSFVGRIDRPKSEQGAVIKDLEVEFKGEKSSVQMDVSPMGISKKEAEKFIKAAKEEIDKSIFVGDDTADRVIRDIAPKKSYQNGQVGARWEFNNYSAIDSTGRIYYEKIDEKTLIDARVYLTCGEVEEIYEFSFMVFPADINTKEGFKYLIQKSLIESNENNQDKSYIQLPKSVEKNKIVWSLPRENTGIYMAVFGVLVGVALFFGGKEDEKKINKKRQEAMERDYPDIVSMLSLYVGAGIGLKSSFMRIADNYKNLCIKGVSKKSEGFEGVCMLCRDIEGGKGEYEAYKDFGKRMGHKDYRRLSLMICQNMRKGSTALIDQLENEEHQAFEMRKIRAKVAGERASTKLLLPMIGLLAVVLTVLVFPAFMGLSL